MAVLGGGGINLEGLLKEIAIASRLVGQDAERLTGREKRKLKKAILAIAKQIPELNTELNSPDGGFNPHEIKQITSVQCEEVLHYLGSKYNISTKDVSGIVEAINSSADKSSTDQIITGKLTEITAEQRNGPGNAQQVVSMPPANGLGPEETKGSNVRSAVKRNRILDGLCQ